VVVVVEELLPILKDTQKLLLLTILSVSEFPRTSLAQPREVIVLPFIAHPFDLFVPASLPDTSSCMLFRYCLLLFALLASTSTVIPFIVEPDGIEKPKLEHLSL
jgi:hypothetical protein